MGKFAFIIHPIELSDIYRKFGFLRYFPQKIVEALIKRMSPFKVSEITGIKSPYGETKGWFVTCPLTSRQMVELPLDFVLNKIIQAGKVGQELGADIIGLGAMTSVVGDAGITIAKNLEAAVTTGNSYTVATALEGTKKAAQLMDIDLEKAEVLVVGATGSIGSAAARILARECRYLTLLARDERKLDYLARQIMKESGLAVRCTSNIKRAVPSADIIIAVTGSAEAVIKGEDLKPGAVVCDVARPRDVSKAVAEKRKDVLVIEGGVVQVPGPVNFNFDFGFPPGTSYACMAETMILALEDRFENFSLGRDIRVSQIDTISQLAEKHAFKLAGFRSFERAISEEEILAVKDRAKEKIARASRG